VEQIAQMLPEHTKDSLAKLLSDRLKAIESMTPEELEAKRRRVAQARVDSFNSKPGQLATGYTNSDNNYVPGDGYNCQLCMNRGATLVLEERNGYIYERMVECKCMDVRRSIWRMKASGLEQSIRDYTFKRFEAKEPWQKAMFDMAKAYLAEGAKDGKWLYFGGQPGCGKTHLCTAVAGKLLYEEPVMYVIWPQISKKLKAIVNDAEEYDKEITKLETIAVLYIDDLFKPVKDDKGNITQASGPDKKLAFELLNYRYINRLPTIISSEWGLEELNDMDEATGSRVAERSRGYNMMVCRDRKRNYRLSDTTAV